MDIVLLLIFGLAGLVIGGDLLVRGAVDLARRIGLSPLVIGLTLVGFGTSTPELVTSLQAAFAGSPGIAVGNVVGSNIANILLILGLAAVLAPVVVERNAFRRDGAVLALSALMCLVAVQYDSLSPTVGMVFITALIAYVAVTIIRERRSVAAEASIAIAQPKGLAEGSVWKDLVFVVGGLGLTILGARFLVTGAISIASSFGVSEAVIGLTIVAVGTSLPELVTTIAAARQGQSDIAFGNIVGSNIFNVLFIMGATALIKPIEVPASIASFDIWIMIGATALLLLFAVTRWRISRIEGALLLLAYVAYTAWLGLGAAS
ncbi:calcium/sodium antiporter [Parvularcula sp. IMCC14364]|uniref:calcium/sodium antiporter n=1 Tax=Parvularcula sp. IMCC14364 TaxID=3067902 RepID=UPI002741DF15|nr:calcium/sodium antiporter [Parvularcula sp. IMCC14364]